MRTQCGMCTPTLQWRGALRSFTRMSSPKAATNAWRVIGANSMGALMCSTRGRENGPELQRDIAESLAHIWRREAVQSALVDATVLWPHTDPAGSARYLKKTPSHRKCRCQRFPSKPELCETTCGQMSARRLDGSPGPFHGASTSAIASSWPPASKALAPPSA